MASPVLYGQPPIVGDRAHTLILGNMPSVMSLAAQQYYGNPRNVFWRIVGDIFAFSAEAPYRERVSALEQNGIAVWDVLRSCRRIGSLDSAVEPDSMEVNDFERLLAGCPHITRAFFNGAAAERNFRRLVVAGLVGPDLTYRRLPSTSPAQTMRYVDKLAVWREALTARR